MNDTNFENTEILTIIDEKNFFYKAEEEKKKDLKKINKLDWTLRGYAAENYERKYDTECEWYSF